MALREGAKALRHCTVTTPGSKPRKVHYHDGPLAQLPTLKAGDTVECGKHGGRFLAVENPHHGQPGEGPLLLVHVEQDGHPSEKAHAEIKRLGLSAGDKLGPFEVDTDGREGAEPGAHRFKAKDKGEAKANP